MGVALLDRHRLQQIEALALRHAVHDVDEYDIRQFFRSNPVRRRGAHISRADEYAVLATPNLNGDYISDACAAQVGGLGIAPGANIGDGYACFEATHGTAPKYADKDVINPGSVILSGVMMFRFLGWNEAADLIERGLERTIEQKKVTYDFERLMEGATKVKTSEFGSYIIGNMESRVLAEV